MTESPLLDVRNLAVSFVRVVEVNEVDGVRATLRTGEIVHLRPSGNAPELRCYAEADRTERAQELCAWGLRELPKAGLAAKHGDAHRKWSRCEAIDYG